MGHEYFWMSGMWIFPVTMVVVVLAVVYLLFGRGSLRPPGCGSEHSQGMGKNPESSLEILKKRYAKGEITKDEFEQIKKDIL